MGQYPWILHPPHPGNQGIEARNGLSRQDHLDWPRNTLRKARDLALA
jgi:hypothetical protein